MLNTANTIIGTVLVIRRRCSRGCRDFCLCLLGLLPEGGNVGGRPFGFVGYTSDTSDTVFDEIGTN
jgi:hypothetical protein